MKHGSLALALALAATSASAAPVNVLGVEIFGMAVPQLPRCPRDSRQMKHLCAAQSPFVHKPTGGSIVKVWLPNAETLPRWAELAFAELHLDKTRRVEVLKLSLISVSEKHAIATAISQRFGLPVWSNLPAAGVATGADWKTSDLHIQLVCGPVSSDHCTVEFTALPVFEANQAARTARETARKPL